MVVPLTGKLIANAGPGLAIQEALYGFIMAMIFVNAAQVGIIYFDSNIHLAFIILSMNFTWGIIDVLIIILVGSLERKRDINILLKSRENDCAECESIVKDDLSGTILDAIEPADERRIILQILSSKIKSDQGLRKDRAELIKAGMSSFVITVLAALPAIIPLLLIPDLTSALFAASALGSVALFFVGYTMSKYIGANRWRMALVMTLVGWSVTIMATFMGG
ncbi:MAG: hypothetical protein EOM93_05900 [Gammaproteobacteria bacterium]|nr:hypothetical protein [Gammaproteobacteria bacterium]